MSRAPSARPTRNQIQQRGRRRARAAARRFLRRQEEAARARHRVDPPETKDRPKRERIKEPHEPLSIGQRARYYSANGRVTPTPKQNRRLGQKVRRQKARGDA